MNIHAEVIRAENRIRPYILETPVEYSPYLSRLCEAEVWLKMEHLQITGSFKLRGATNKLLSLADSDKKKGVITASTGNHGAACAYISDLLGYPCTIFLPENVAPNKVEMMKLYDVTLQFYGNDSLLSEQKAREVATKENRVFVSPYNDLQVLSGQGTIGVELLRQVRGLDTVFIPVGGGGLISGIAGYLKHENPQIKVIGCQPINSPVMHASIDAGKIVELPNLPTLSDGTAGGLEEGSITFEFCQQYVDNFIDVSEKEIKSAWRFLLEKHYLLVEGAAALSVASLLQQKRQFKGKKVVLILCGRKMGIEKMKELLKD